VVQTIVIAMMKVAAAVNSGRSRAAIQTINGHRAAMARSKVQFGIKIRNVHKPLNTASDKIPSAISRFGGNSRKSAANPIISGAIVMVPSASEANQ